MIYGSSIIRKNHAPILRVPDIAFNLSDLSFFLLPLLFFATINARSKQAFIQRAACCASGWSEKTLCIPLAQQAAP